MSFKVGEYAKVIKVLNEDGTPSTGAAIVSVGKTGRILDIAPSGTSYYNYKIVFEDGTKGDFSEGELEPIPVKEEAPIEKAAIPKTSPMKKKKKVTASRKAPDEGKSPAPKVTNRIDKTTIDKVREEMNIVGLEKEQQIVKLAAQNDFPVLLIGETGVGKTYLLRHIAKEMNIHMIRMSLNGEIGINELLGKWLVKDGATFWQDGVLTECMRNGWWIMLDEINAALPEVLFCLNALLDDSRSIVLSEKDGEEVKPHANFRVFATMNPPEEYAGTKEMNKALLSRFPVVLLLKDYEPKTELDIIRYQSKIETEIAMIIVDIGNIIRKLKMDRKIWYTCSTRDLVNYARLLSCDNNSMGLALAYSVLNKSAAEDRKTIITAIQTHLPVKLDWNWNKDTVMMKISGDLKLDIDKLQEKKDRLHGMIGDLQHQLSAIKDEV